MHIHWYHVLYYTDGVTNIEIVGFSVHSIFVTWRAPINHTDDGVFGNYAIRCTSGYTSVLTSTVTIVTGLQPFTNYTCCITPHWVTNGAGPETCISTTTQEDGESTAAALKVHACIVVVLVMHWSCTGCVLLAPASPPVNVRVRNASSYSVLVQWLPPVVPNGIITHYSIYINYNNGTHPKRQVGADNSLYLLEELRPHQMVGIRISASTIAGEGPLSVEKSTWTNEAGMCIYEICSNYALLLFFLLAPGSVNDLTVIATSHTSVNITWSPPYVLNGIIIYYHITLTKQASRHKLIVDLRVEPANNKYSVTKLGESLIILL